MIDFIGSNPIKLRLSKRECKGEKERESRTVLFGTLPIMNHFEGSYKRALL